MHTVRACAKISRHSGNSNTESICECHGITGMSGNLTHAQTVCTRRYLSPRGRPGNEASRNHTQVDLFDGQGPRETTDISGCSIRGVVIL